MKYLIVLTILIAACSKPNNKSELNITSGYFVKKTDLDVIPAVPRLQGCTSTIVSDTTLPEFDRISKNEFQELSIDAGFRTLGAHLGVNPSTKMIIN